MSIADVDYCRTAADVREAARKVRERRSEVFFKPAQPAPNPDLSAFVTPLAQPAPATPPGPPVPKSRLELLVDQMNREMDTLSKTCTWPAITREMVIHAVAKRWKVSRRDLKSKRRGNDIVRPRQVCMLLCKMITGASLPKIGYSLGKRDHTTVLHGIRRMEWVRSQLDEIMDDDNTLEQWVDQAFRITHPGLRITNPGTPNV
jgi:hypothetical protein